MTTEEVIKACTSSKNQKAPGSGNIPAELIKSRTEQLYKHVRKIFQDCIYGSDIPQEWNQAHLSTIYIRKVIVPSAKTVAGISVTATMSTYNIWKNCEK